MRHERQRPADSAGRRPVARRVSALASALVLTLALTACDTAEERAERHFQAGLEYLQAGDIDRALVELRNVFKLDGSHREARRTYAEAERKRGHLREAYAQYLRLVEQYPDDLDALRALAEIAATGSDWAAALDNADKALRIEPGNPELLAIRTAAEYGVAIQSNDVGRLARAAQQARRLLDGLPGNLLLRRVVIDDLMRAQRFEDALAEIDHALALFPDDRPLYAQKLAALAALGRDADVEQTLHQMIARHPDAPELRATLIRWHLARNEIDKAEAFLRSRVSGGPIERDDVLNLVRFLATWRGPDAAVTELERVIAHEGASPAYLSAYAAFLFDMGRRDDAIARMQELVDSLGEDDDALNARVALARMLTVAGQNDRAATLIDSVLSRNPVHPEALKLQAAALIRDDRVGDAIAVLRRALASAPRDADILSLMAEAYERDGNRDLMRESLSRAVELSNAAPIESLRYAQFLANEGRYLPAESVLIDALRISPGHPGLLGALGEIYLRVQDWPRARSVADALEATSDPAARARAHEIRAAILAQERDTTEALRYLTDLAESGEGGRATRIAILRTHLDNGDIEKARAYAASLLADSPDDPQLRLLDASVLSLTGDLSGAEQRLRDLVARQPHMQPAWAELIRIVATDPARSDETARLLDQAQELFPDAADLKWARASLLQRLGQIDAAIAVYEDLYRTNSANPVIANNLASLLSNHRSDPDSLARAEIIARRLRDSDDAPYQDTYGWIAYLRGDIDAAERHFARAAQALPDDPMVQYHMSMVHLSRGRRDQARAVLERAQGLVADPDGEIAKRIKAALADLATGNGAVAN
ncbi:tetratricopeptide repeat protein [Albidovulum inexpectatum]|uniref:Tetratricopeptide repeat protein n=1 Tax=Albidovulum inexpectatum TaxID=196587 RepID=A0A2S5JDU6_9RHOB|nr:tetratricopeptide repeat protein [Albidovulum inexpectatum]PPB79657.1 tetratricopeptide repeat protein [Albidovulum inexpectatum]